MAPRTVRYTYRLRPGKGAARALEAEWDACRWVWNALVATSNDERMWNEIARAYGAGPDQVPTFGAADQDKRLTSWRSQHPWLAEGSSVAQQQTVRDFAAARAKALLDRKNQVKGRRRGLPRFKAKDRVLPSMNFTRRGFTLKTVTGHDGRDRVRLCLPGGVVVPVVWSRELPSDPSSVRVSRDSLGHWYASFVVQAETEHLPPTPQADPIGVDWGVSRVAVTTDPAYDLPYAGHRKNAQPRLNRYQRMMARRRPKPGRPASKGYRQAKTQAARAHRKVADQRADTARKWAKNVVRDHDRIAVEDFRPAFMSRNRSLSAKAADGATGLAKKTLIEMAAKHGRDLRLVNPAHTSMDCSSCGARATHRLPLSERTYTCTACGLVKDRDFNSAAVMVARAGFDPACVDGIRPAVPSGTWAA